MKWTKNDVYGPERTSDSIFVKTHSGNTCGRQLGQLDDRADGGTSSGKCSKTVRTADSKSTTSDKALVSDEETAIVLAQPARFASEETMHGFLLKSFIGTEREPAADRCEGGAQDTRRGLSAHAYTSAEACFPQPPAAALFARLSGAPRCGFWAGVAALNRAMRACMYICVCAQRLHQRLHGMHV